MADERWLPVPDYPNYEASDQGRIRNRRLGRVLGGTVTRDGCVQVSIRGLHGRQVALAHRLVCAAFHGPAPEGYVCTHINGQKRENRPDNIKWVTQAANVRHARDLGLLRCGRVQGDFHPSAKLNSAAVVEMRVRRAAGERLSALAREYGVTTQAAHLVVSRRRWRHIA